MTPPTPHVMRLNRAHADRSEEWICPTCGRRILLERTPHYRSQILDAGDESASHVGGAAQWGSYQLTSPALGRMGLFSLRQAPSDDESIPFDAADYGNELLRPWLKWLNESSHL